MNLEALKANLQAARLVTWCPHKPTPKQREFVALDCIEASYGGAAGGGKSDALLMAALKYVHVPGYSALVLRRTFQDLNRAGAIMDRSHDWLDGTAAHWSCMNKRWTFPSGARLTFGYLETEQDKKRYDGTEFQSINVDELTQFSESQYTYLFSRLRKTGDIPVPLRMRSSAMPGGIGHDWVHRRFIDPATRAARGFVAAKVSDNPFIDPSYLSSLDQLDSVTRDQMLNGNWVRDAAGLVYDRFKDTAIIEDIPDAEKWRTIIGCDFGFDDATAFVVLGWREHDPTVYVMESEKQRGMIPSDAAKRIKALESEYVATKIIGDTGGLGKGYTEEARQRFMVPIEAAEKTNKRGYMPLLNDAFANGRVKIVRESNQELIAELFALMWDRERKKEADSCQNHLTDALLYGWRACGAYIQKALPPKLPEAETLNAEMQAYWKAENDRIEQEKAESAWEEDYEAAE